MTRHPPLPDLSQLSHEQKDELIVALWRQNQALTEQVATLTARVAELEAKLKEPPKTPDNSGTPPSQGRKANREQKKKRGGPRKGSLGRKGGGRALATDPDQVVIAKAVSCKHCQAALTDADQTLHGRYDKVDMPPVRPTVTRVERYVGHCPCCGDDTLAPVPDGLEDSTVFSVSIMALALYLRFVHAISYKRLTRLFLDLFALKISEGALDGLFQRAKPRFDDEVAAILARLRRSRLICCDETTVRVDGRTQWNWVFQNDAVVIHVIRPSRGRGVVTEVLGGHRPQIWVSDLYGAQQGHADRWQICLAHQLRDLRYAIEAGDSIFAPKMKILLLRAVVLARRRQDLKESTRLQYLSRLHRDLSAILALNPTNRHGQRLKKRYLKHREGLFTFLRDPSAPPDNNGSERELRPMTTYRKVTGGFRSEWGRDLCAAVKSVIGTAKRNGLDAYQAILSVLYGKPILEPG
ncbi:MAG: IS66 family transposase [Gammaproteobacteria bacterium]|jgi:transposase|nr:IS66 family transposase [Gammaproteobacteria bacterium]